MSSPKAAKRAPKIVSPKTAALKKAPPKTALSKTAQPKTAQPKTAQPKSTAPKTAAPRAKPAAQPALSDRARALAAELEHELAEGRTEALSAEALQSLTAAVCKTYSAQVEGGNQYLPLAHRTAIASTDVMTMASGLLRGANLAVFELGMWQSWTGR
jgi:hypothetical protein